jgi:hypothetical protein
MQRVKELVQQHRVAAGEAVPIRSIDTGQIVEHAQVSFRQLRSSRDLVEKQGGTLEPVPRMRLGARVRSDYWRWGSAPQAL